MSDSKLEISRVTRTRAETRAAYDRISRWYDVLEGRWEGKPKELGLKKLGAQEGECVLEIGYGTGHAIMTLAKAVGESGKVYGIDLSPRMRAIAQARAAEHGLAPRVLLKNGDAAALPFAPGFFDAVFMSFVLELFDTPEIPRVLSECGRVLKSGGRICVVSLSKAGRSGWMTRLYEWGHARFPGLLDCRPIFVQSALEEAGLQTCEATRLSLWGLPVELVVSRAR